MSESDSVCIGLRVNGQHHRVRVSPEETLLETLRKRLGLKGTKDGCAEGVCGACTVIVNGQAKRACHLRTVSLDGACVRTVEGLAAGNQLHPVQQAFIDEGAVGCGFCTPGMLMAAVALLEADPSPSEDAIRRALQPVLCRCTGYWPIVRAVQRAAGQPVKRRRREVGTVTPMRVVGQSVSKIDAVEKVTGRAIFAGDLDLPGQLYAVLVRSPHAHARVLHVESAEAQMMPGVAAVLTARDIPGQNGFGKNRPDQPVLAEDRVSYCGQPVALVAAESPELARRAAECVVVQYEVLPPVLTAEEAFTLGGPEHILHHINLSRGDVAKGFGEAAVVVERTFRTQRTDSLFLEPPSGVAEVDATGCITIHTACQHPYGLRMQIARVLDIPETQVRILQTACGGGFGAKVEALVQIYLALLAFKLHRPIKMVLTRQETFLTAVKRHPMIIKYRAGATTDGHLTALQIEILTDTGAFETSGVPVLSNACHQATGPYEAPNVQIDGWACRTNHVPSGAQRGFGVPQVAFAHESVMDELAAKLGLTPLEIRERNILTSGSTLVSGQRLAGAVPAREVLRAVVPLTALDQCEKHRGRGIALGFKSVGYSGGAENVASVEIEINDDGRAIVRAGGLDMGQGSTTTLAQIAAEELGFDVAQVEVLPTDTADELDCGSTEASRFTIAAGRALLDAAARLRERLVGEASIWLGTTPGDLQLADGHISTKDAQRDVSLADLAARCRAEGRALKARGSVSLPMPGQPIGDGAARLSAVDVTFCAAGAEVEVDPVTGTLHVLSLILAQDVGRAVNPLNVQVQVEGGATMGFGYATLEHLPWSSGVLGDLRLASYRVPRCRDVPPIATIIVQEPGEVGPYGAKGIGELPVIPVAAAIANAVYDAVGIRVTELPITSAVVRNLLLE